MLRKQPARFPERQGLDQTSRADLVDLLCQQQETIKTLRQEVEQLKAERERLLRDPFQSADAPESTRRSYR